MAKIASYFNIDFIINLEDGTMAKSSKDQIEQDEKKVLSELVKNSNENIETIAKHCGLTRQKVTRTIKQMEAKKLIWGYSTVFDEEKIGKTHFILMIKRKMEKVDEEAVDIIISKKADDIAAEFGIVIESSAYIHGEYDWILTFTAEDIKQAKQFSDRLVALFPHLVQKITIMRTLMFMKKHYVLNPDRKKLKDFM